MPPALVQVAIACLLALWVGAGSSVAPRALPARLADAEFWKLVHGFSEPDGYFRSDNLTSNELAFQHVIPELTANTTPDGVYLGVGPEQNFTYIAAVRPKLAFVIDIRRGNLLLQLMYKAIFELSADRAAFVSMLFSKPRPPGLTATASAAELFSAFAGVPSSDAAHDAGFERITRHLTKTHGWTPAAGDLDGLRHVLSSFYRAGFALRSSPTYAELMTATDAAGVPRSYLADEERFRLLKDLQSRNLVVPIVGDFGGPRAIREIGRYLRRAGATVSVFYLSNVEQYLYRDGKWDAFCRNVAALPLDRASTFIRSSSGRGWYGRGRFLSSLGNIQQETKACAAY